MKSKSRIVAFSGSTRKDSFNQKLVSIAAAAASRAGADVELLSLADFPMPLYDGDLEAAEGMPDHAKRFKEILKASNGLLIASAEYNSSISAVLKNAIDWASRQEEGEGPKAAFVGKTAAILSASPGALGGLRGLYQLRWILGNIDVSVLPEQVTLASAHQAFADDYSLKDGRKLEQVERLAQRLTEVIDRLA
jgi:NAD(P)H-dependent FMN reductase